MFSKGDFMRQILLGVLFCVLAASAAAGALDEPISATTFKEAIARLKSVESRLNEEDARFFRIGFERLDIEVTRHVSDGLSDGERQRLFVSVIDGLTPRKVILLGCIAFVRQTREALQNAKDDELPLRRLDVKHAEELRDQAVRNYARARIER
jgi:hypothetical protein